MPRLISRTFEDYDAATSTKAMPLIVGVTGPQGSGKTFSALRIAAGMAKAGGGAVFVIDTEADRALHYKDRFSFRHVPFAPPHGAADYEQAIEHCLARGAKVIVIDSMSHEHSGAGGLLDQVEHWLDERAGDDWQKREKMKWAAQVQPKAARARLNQKIVQIGARCFFVLCYRAVDRTKPTAGGQPLHLGWQAETTSRLPYDMTARFLLPPGSDGHPNLTPDTEWEALAIKNPGQFRDWFAPGFQLTEEIGERMARWALGPAIPKPPAAAGAPIAGDAGEDSGEREALLDAIRRLLVARHPGRERAARDAKAALLVETFRTKSWDDVKLLDVAVLRDGLDYLRVLQPKAAP